MYDPSIGKESLTSIDVVGVLVGHIIFGVVATLLFDWSWIPLSTQQKNCGKSLKEIKKNWGWDNNEHSQEEKKKVPRIKNLSLKMTKNNQLIPT